MSLNSLPNELLAEVLGHVSFRDICRIARICRRFQAVIEESTEMQYILELGRAGMIDINTQACLGARERLKALIRQRSAWEKGEWIELVTIPQPTQLRMINCYDFVGGLYASSWWSGSTNGHDLLHIARLPSLSAMTAPQQPLYIGRVDARRAAFGIDPSQNLIAFSERSFSETQDSMTTTIYLNSISDGFVHPAAANPTLTYCFPTSYGDQVPVYLHDDMLAVRCTYPPLDRLVIWCWKTGKIVVDTDLTLGSKFAFVTNRCFFLTMQGNPGSIVLFSFSDSECLSELSDGLIAQLDFPQLQDGYTASFDVPEVPQACGPTGYGNWKADPEARVFLFVATIWDREGRPSVMRYFYFVHHRTLRSYLYRYHRQPGLRAWDPIVPWEDWGPQGARLLKQVSASWQVDHLFRPIYGERVVLPATWTNGEDGAEDQPPWDATALCVIDFNVFQVRRSLAQRGYDIPDTGSHVVEVSEPTTMPPEDVFESAVTTSLPYRITRGTLPIEQVDTVMVEQDCLAVLHMTVKEGRAHKVLRVFAV